MHIGKTMIMTVSFIGLSLFSVQIARAIEEPAPLPGPEFVDIIAPTGGVCLAVYVTPGQQVQRGERLISIGPQGGTYIVAPLRDDLQEAMARHQELKNNYLKTLQEFQRGTVATGAVDMALVQAKQSADTMAVARNRLRQGEDAQRPLFVHAPSDGAVKNVAIREGQTVEADETLLTLEITLRAE